MMYSTGAIAALGGPGGPGLNVVDALRWRRMHREITDRPVPPPVLSSLAWAAKRAQMARPGARVIVVVNDPGLNRTARDVLPGLTNNAPAMLVIATTLEGMDKGIGRRGRAAHLAAGFRCCGRVCRAGRCLRAALDHGCITNEVWHCRGLSHDTQRCSVHGTFREVLMLGLFDRSAPRIPGQFRGSNTCPYSRLKRNT
jgi:hypothetical protein